MEPGRSAPARRPLRKLYAAPRTNLAHGPLFLLVLGLLPASVGSLHALALTGACRAGQPALPSSPAPAMVASSVPASAASHAPQLALLLDAIDVALDDGRRVDELVTLFEYSGVVTCGTEVFEGQGAVKRFFTRLLLDQGEPLTAALEPSPAPPPSHEPSSAARLVLRGASTSMAVELRVTGVRPGATQIDALHVTVGEGGGADGGLVRPGIASLAAGAGELGRPKWETFDGRVRQRIWDSADVFAEGNAFLIETMGLTTGRLILCVDATVWELYRPKMELWASSVGVRLEPIVAPGNEDQKTIGTFAFLLDELKRTDPLRRSEPVLAVGGGVLTDTAGFACACWRRGIPWCRLPTTLLGMVDASVGIKVAINYHRKNGVGHFYSPLHTFIDPSFLSTVSLPDIRSGVGEIMKAALVHDRRLYEIMDEHGARLIEERFENSPEASEVIRRSVDTMLTCIGPDLWEEALLRPMDFGHSFSRTLEADEAFKLRHGEAVAIDCIMSSLVAEQKGLLPSHEATSMLELYAKLGLPCSIEGITAQTYKKARDEIIVHRDGIGRMPLPAGIGKCAYADVITDEEIDGAFARLSAFIDTHPQVCWNPSKSFETKYTAQTFADAAGAK